MPPQLSHLASPEVRYVLLIAGLFIIPRMLQRFRLPSAVTCVLIGTIFGMGLDILRADATVSLLGVLGIVSLFLFAGLEVQFDELRRGAFVIIVHLALQTLLLVVAASLVWYFLYVNVRVSILYALAILTPSTGFILDSLHAFGLSLDQRYWVKSKAIAAELLALGVLFATTQSQSRNQLIASATVLFLMTISLPKLFRIYARYVLPFAPNSQFAFLVMVALVYAAITRALGVYYLVGAFMVGVAARRFGEDLRRVDSKELLRSVELFASFFIPFYFFKVGLRLTPEDFGWRSVGLAVLFLVLAVPTRVAFVALHRARAFDCSFKVAARVGISMVPTLVFTIVIAHILRDQFNLSRTMYGALVVYAVATTLIPSMILGATQEYDRPPSLIPPGRS